MKQSKASASSQWLFFYFQSRLFRFRLNTFFLLVIMAAGWAREAVAIPGEEQWRTNVGLVINSPAISPSGRIYFGSLDNLYAFDVATGKELWRVPLAVGHASVAVDRQQDGAGAMEETLYVCSFASGVSAVDGITGTNKWTIASASDESPAVSSGELLYVTTDTGVHALRKQDGTEVWVWPKPVTEPVVFAPVIGADGTIYFGTFSGKYYALSGTDGTVKWQFQTGSIAVSTPALGRDGTVYVGSYDHKVYGLDGATGLKIWEFQTGERITSSAAVDTNGVVYIGSNDNKFYALDGATGQKKWEFVTGNPANSPPALTADGTVYFGSNDRKLYALNTVTGNKLWEFNTGDQVDGAPNIGADGSVIFISRDSFLYSLKGTGPLAESSWPRYRRDPANTGRALLTRPVITLEQPSVTGTNTFSFQVKGLASLSARVQVSTNLIDWDHLATLPAGGADTNLFFDTQAKTVGCRFYRVVTP